MIKTLMKDQAILKSLTRKQVAERSGVTTEAVRFYEKEGIIANPPRTESGYRQYPQEVVRQIQFVKRAQHLGFTLPEIKDLLSLKISEDTTPDNVRARAFLKIQEVDSRIQTLQRIKNTLLHLAKSCPGEGKIEECPILGALESDESLISRSL